MLRIVGVCMILLGGTLFLAFGLFSLASGQVDLDFRYFYSAGLAWRSGLNPYDLEQYQRAFDAEYQGFPEWALECTFAYAPTAAAILLPFAALPPHPAKLAMRAINAASAVALAAFLFAAARRRVEGPGASAPQRLLPWAVAALTLASPATANNAIMGQTTLLTVALLALAWWARGSGRPALCGALAAVASFKPSVGVFVFAVLLLEHDWRTVTALVVTSLLMAAVPLWQQGPVDLAGSWLEAMRLYRGVPAAQPEFFASFGAASLLEGAGLPHSFTPLIALGGFAWTYWRRQRLEPPELFSLCLAWPVLFIMGHGYDIVALLPLLASALLAARRSLTATVLVLSLIGVASMPVALVRLITDNPLAMHFREVAYLILLARIIISVEWRRPGAGSATEDGPRRGDRRTPGPTPVPTPTPADARATGTTTL